MSDVLAVLLQVVAVLTLLAFAVMWLADSVRHRFHLQQVEQDLRRLLRLEVRIRGVVTELENKLVTGLPPARTEVHESLMGPLSYLSAQRIEAADAASNASRHRLKVRWPSGYLSRNTLAARRCEDAHAALSEAWTAMRDTARLIEAETLRRHSRGNDPQPNRLRRHRPLFLFRTRSARELVRLRDSFDESVRAVSEVTRVNVRALGLYESSWPIWRSELVSQADAYGTEVRPVSWNGLGGGVFFDADSR